MLTSIIAAELDGNFRLEARPELVFRQVLENVNVSDLREILQYVPRFRERVFVIALDGEVALRTISRTFCWTLRSCDR